MSSYVLLKYEAKQLVTVKSRCSNTGDLPAKAVVVDSEIGSEQQLTLTGYFEFVPRLNRVVIMEQMVKIRDSMWY